jgi:hypothetical protein
MTEESVEPPGPSRRSQDTIQVPSEWRPVVALINTAGLSIGVLRGTDDYPHVWCECCHAIVSMQLVAMDQSGRAIEATCDLRDSLTSVLALAAAQLHHGADPPPDICR